jgi:hypothetical protein
MSGHGSQKEIPRNRRVILDRRLKSGSLKLKTYKIEANGYNPSEGDCPAPRNEIRFEVILSELLEEDSAGTAAPVDYDPRYCGFPVIIHQLIADPEENQIDLLSLPEDMPGCS